MNVVTFYRFVRIDDPVDLAATLRQWCDAYHLRGTILVAAEGINATLAGDAGLDAFIAQLRTDARFADIVARASSGADDNPIFYRMKVRVRDEIVALKCPAIDPARRSGTHVDAQQWNALLDDPQLLLIDARNRYEVALGTFPGARDPDTKSFREFPEFAATLDATEHPRVAMFCTGGIRCEKASAYLLEQGFETVYQLDGGILNYLENAGADNRFVGECFVFDQRVSVDQTLEEGEYAICHACRHPLSRQDLASPRYVADQHCGHCMDDQTSEQRAAFAERARQARLAASRGERHVGARMQPQKERSS